MSPLTSEISCWQAAASPVRSSANADVSARSATGAIRRPGGAELPRREVEAVGVAFDRRARDLDAAALAGADGVQQLLAPHARAGVAEDDGRALLGMLQVPERLGEERVGALLHAGDPDEPRLAEQGGRGQGEQRAGFVVVGADIGDLERWHPPPGGTPGCRRSRAPRTPLRAPRRARSTRAAAHATTPAGWRAPCPSPGVCARSWPCVQPTGGARQQRVAGQGARSRARPRRPAAAIVRAMMPSASVRAITAPVASRIASVSPLGCP